jgi:hypothetical protein
MVARIKGVLLGIALVLLCALVAVIGLGWMFVSVVFNSSRAWRLAVSFDQLANTAFGGHEDETISSRAGKAARKGKPWACVLCRLLDWFEPDHCEKNIEPDRGKSLT